VQEEESKLILKEILHSMEEGQEGLSFVAF
jgi:hypothetical protein